MRKEITASYLESQGFSETFLDRFWSKVIKNKKGCWGWTASTTSWGYGKIFTGPSTKNLLGAHVASWFLHKGEIPKDLNVLHTCDNPPCSNPKHLFLGTTKDNSEDMIKKGRHVPNGIYGELCGNHVLTDSKVRRLRLMAKLGYDTHKTLGALFGIDESTVFHVIHRKTWKHI